MKKAFLPLYLVLALASLISCTGGLPPEFPAPDFTLKSPISAKETSFSSLKGRPVIIYWFTSW